MIIAIIVSLIIGAFLGVFIVGLCSANSINETEIKIKELEMANEQLRGLLKDAYKEINNYETKTKVD